MSSQRTPLELERVGELSVIRLSAEWIQPQPAYLEQLRRTLVELAAGDDPPRVAVDVSALQRLDAHLLGLLVQFQQRFRGQGGRIVLAGCSPQLENLLKVTHLASVLATAPTLEQAMAALGAEASQPVAGPARQGQQESAGAQQPEGPEPERPQGPESDA